MSSDYTPSPESTRPGPLARVRRWVSRQARPRPVEPGPAAPTRAATTGATPNAATRVFSYRWDEALRDDPHMALAMRRDPYLMALLRERQYPVAQLGGKVFALSGRAESVALAGRLTAIVRRTPDRVRMRMAMLEALWYGRYGIRLAWDEVVSGRREDGSPAKWWGIAGWEPVNGDKLQTDFDGLWVLAVNPSEQARWPEQLRVTGDRFPGIRLATESLRLQYAIHRHEIDDADYYEGEQAGVGAGVGIRSRIYWCVWMRDRLLSWGMDALQKTGTAGVWLFTFSMGNVQEQAAANAAAEEFEQSNILVVPVPPAEAGFPPAPPVTHIPGDTSGLTVLREFVSQYFEKHVERYVVGQSLSAGTEGSGLGGSGVAGMHTDTKNRILTFDAINLDGTWTSDIVAPVLRLNFPGEDAGEYVWGSTLPDGTPVDPELAELTGQYRARASADGTPTAAADILS